LYKLDVGAHPTVAGPRALCCAANLRYHQLALVARDRRNIIPAEIVAANASERVQLGRFDRLPILHRFDFRKWCFRIHLREENGGAIFQVKLLWGVEG
jgi:hypothetical protein